MYLVFIAALLPLYIITLKKDPHSNFAGFLGWLLPLSAALAITGFVQDIGLSSLLLYMALSCLSFNIGNLPVFTKSPRSAMGYKWWGVLGIAIILLISSFHSAWQIGLYFSPADGNMYVWGAVLIAAISCAVVTYTKTRVFSIYILVTLLFPALYFTVTLNDVFPAIGANLLLLAMSLLTIKKGIDRFDFRILNFGLLLIAILVTCRFFDLNVSFAIRGLMFVAVGAGFFAANYILAKRKKNNPLNVQPHEN
ncbi:MAG: hypothetical protein V4581_09925 [Bacteroidota bacterium]